MGSFKPLSEFDWNWPTQCDRFQIEEILLKLEFIKDATNIVVLGPNGAGKSTIASNITYQAVLSGHTALLVSASDMLNDLQTQDGSQSLNRRLKYYTNPHLLMVDEIGYLSYSNAHADLLFEIISRRYQKKSTIITTNKPFLEWDQIFPNASCVVSLIDRLIHRSELISIEAPSYRLKEAKERRAALQKAREQKKAFGTKVPFEHNEEVLNLQDPSIDHFQGDPLQTTIKELE